ncbi:metalloregulator ArsR/SmtB family transcription factor [Breoghania sp.]|uniref:ArsR/SmtB family transcription factor n=1 Tax=Breoghania sp. TaxID=2065378 RepID=UPI0026252B39|nr:metalloregulator ArsR/SmtB family transcription factor [Breoghania sp.]MDJ0931124.1 metalloregulator ArsR/SmtB family transcription factor [Breoghania sp.]
MIDTDAVTALAALAHDDRLRAFRLLVKVGPNGLTSGEIAENLAIQPTRMSFHLATLERAGLLHARRAGRKVIYAVEFERMRTLLVFLTEDCCNGHPEICGDPAGVACIAPVPASEEETT